MTADPTEMHDLSEDDIASKPLEPPLSPLVLTGITFQGLEQSDLIDIREWKGKPEPRESAADKQNPDTSGPPAR
jgi:hypothetical protein